LAYRQIDVELFADHLLELVEMLERAKKQESMSYDARELNWLLGLYADVRDKIETLRAAIGPRPKSLGVRADLRRWIGGVANILEQLWVFEFVREWHERKLPDQFPVVRESQVTTLREVAERIAKTVEATARDILESPNQAEVVNESSPDSSAGFLGGADLARALGIHITQRDAFFQRLMRQRTSLGDDCWHEDRDPRPNSPRYHYRVDSPKLRDLAAGYKNPKPTA
jgi:hypothetical protein